MAQEFKETSFANINQKKFKENYNKIFGERYKLDCGECGLSSRQKLCVSWSCPHCLTINKVSPLPSEER